MADRLQAVTLATAVRLGGSRVLKHDIAFLGASGYRRFEDSKTSLSAASGPL